MSSSAPISMSQGTNGTLTSSKSSSSKNSTIKSSSRSPDYKHSYKNCEKDKNKTESKESHPNVNNNNIAPTRPESTFSIDSSSQPRGTNYFRAMKIAEEFLPKPRPYSRYKMDRIHLDQEKENKKKLEEYKEFFKKNSKMREYGGHDKKIHSVDWNCDGRRLASGSVDKTVGLYYLDNYKLKTDQVLRGHNDNVDQLRWHPKYPDLLGTASADRSVKIWDARDYKIVENFTTIGENINIVWHPNGNEIAVGNKDDLITFIDVRAGKILKEVPFQFEVNEICWSPDAYHFLLTKGDGCVDIYEYPEMTLKNTIKAHPSNCICIDFRKDGQYFAIGGADAVISLWHYAELTCVRTFSRLDWPIRALSFNYDGALIASGSEDLVIDISHVDGGERVSEINVEAPTFTLAWHPTKNLLAYAVDDKNKYERDRDRGTIKLYGLPNDA